MTAELPSSKHCHPLFCSSVISPRGFLHVKGIWLPLSSSYVDLHTVTFQRTVQCVRSILYDCMCLPVSVYRFVDLLGSRAPLSRKQEALRPRGPAAEDTSLQICTTESSPQRSNHRVPRHCNLTTHLINSSIDHNWTCLLCDYTVL
jgi:hypothetical protein